MATGDVTGDGRDDLVAYALGHSTDNVTVLEQDPLGGFGPGSLADLGENSTPNGVAVGDVTGDGLADVVVTYGGNRPTSMVAVFAQDGTGGLAAPVAYPSHDIPTAVRIADMDGDGRQDVVVVHPGWVTFGIYVQTTRGTLAPEERYPLPNVDRVFDDYLAVGDLNGDGRPDVAVAAQRRGLVVFRNVAP
jgi:hypothetical protein